MSDEHLEWWFAGAIGFWIAVFTVVGWLVGFEVEPQIPDRSQEINNVMPKQDSWQQPRYPIESIL